MLKFKVFVLVFSLFVANTINASSRIIGGSKVVDGRFKFSASLIIDSDYSCAGTLIGEHWVVSAAHCFAFTGVGNRFKEIQPSQVEVRLFCSNITSDKCENYSVANIYWLGFDHVKFTNDIVVLELSQNVSFPEKAISVTSAAPNEGDMLTVMGWGLTDTNDKTAKMKNILHFVDVPMVSRYDCKRSISQGKITPDTLICAGYPEGGKDSCQGDSGGPLVKAEGNSHVLVGVTSSGYGCARPNSYGFYTNISIYSERINSLLSGDKSAFTTSYKNNYLGDSYWDKFWDIWGGSMSWWLLAGLFGWTLVLFRRK